MGIAVWLVVRRLLVVRTGRAKLVRMVLMETRDRQSPKAVRLVLRAGPHQGLFVIRPARWGRRVRRWAARRRGRSW